MKVSIFIDGANYFYMQRTLGWHIDAKKVLDYCERFGDIVDAYYYIGKDSPSEAGQQAYLNALVYMGYALVTKPIKTIVDHQTGNPLQKANLDIEIVLDMFNTIDHYDMAILISGDGDFERPLQLLKARGKHFKVLSTMNCIASEIRNMSGRHFIDFQNIRNDVEKLP